MDFNELVARVIAITGSDRTYVTRLVTATLTKIHDDVRVGMAQHILADDADAVIEICRNAVANTLELAFGNQP